MRYAKIYCELKASLSAEIATMKSLKGELRILEQNKEDIQNIEKCKQEWEKQKQIVENQKKQLSKLESELKSLSSDLDDVELKIFTLHYIKGCSLKKIAKKLFFSYDRVKQISRKINEKIGEKH